MLRMRWAGPLPRLFLSSVMLWIRSGFVLADYLPVKFSPKKTIRQRNKMLDNFIHINYQYWCICTTFLSISLTSNKQVTPRNVAFIYNIYSAFWFRPSDLVLLVGHSLLCTACTSIKQFFTFRDFNSIQRKMKVQFICLFFLFFGDKFIIYLSVCLSIYVCV